MKLLHLCFALLFLVLNSCAAMPTTKVCEGDIGLVPNFLVVLPFKDLATKGEISEQVLGELQEKLVKELQSGKRFTSVAASNKLEGNADAVMQCTITQFDPVARRMVVVTEITSARNGSLLAKLVTHADIASIAFPFDYVGALSSLEKAIIKDISKVLSQQS